MSEEIVCGAKLELMEAMTITSSGDARGNQIFFEDTDLEKDPLATDVSDPLATDRINTLYQVSTNDNESAFDEESKEVLTLIAGGANDTIQLNDTDSALPVAKPQEIEEFVQISNADSSNDAALGNHKAVNTKTSDEEEEQFEVFEVIESGDNNQVEGTRCDKNDTNYSEGKNSSPAGSADSTTVKSEQGLNNKQNTIVFKVIEIEKPKKSSPMDPEQAKKIALEQIQSIGPKKRGKTPKESPEKSGTSGASLVTSLVLDWSDNEKDESIERNTKSAPPIPMPVQSADDEKIAVVPKKQALKIKPKHEQTIASAKSPRAPRVIKKKIIWDPDAPETQFSYASLIKVPTTTPKKRKSSTSTSVPPPKVSPSPQTVERPKATTFAVKPKVVAATKPKVVMARKSVQSSVSPINQPKVRILNIGKRSASATSIPIGSKRKRVTEIDKLLSDEGAANMLNTIESVKTESSKEARMRKMPTPTVVAKARPSVVAKVAPNVVAKNAQNVVAKVAPNIVAKVAPKKDMSPKKEVAPRKRIPRQSASSSWDYVYNQRNVDSLIIRRRSNSSYSSTTSPRHHSFEAKPARALKNKIFEFIKPGARTGKRSIGGSTEKLIVQDIKQTIANESKTSRKSSRTPVPSEQKESTSSSATSSSSVKIAKPASAKDDKHEVVSIKRHSSNVVQLILRPKLDKMQNSFTMQLMNEVAYQLDILKADNSCKVVIITSAGPNFSSGVDIVGLLQGNAEKRRNAASDLATSVTTFLKALLSFPKPLIAGVVGSCSGIGVTMLPAFDVVISSDKSTFETAYAKIGQIPEGHGILTSTNNVRQPFKTKLLWLCEKQNSNEAAASGLITKTTTPPKVFDETLQYAKRLASFSHQSLLSMKSQRHDIKKLISTLHEEQKILVSQWQTSECQEKLKQYLTKELVTF